MLGFGPISDQPISSTPAPVASGTAYTLTADAAAFTISAQDAALVRGRVVTADAAAFTESAQDASLLIGRVVTADAAAYTVAAQDATLTYTPFSGGYTITADAAAFTWAVQDAALTYTPGTPVTPSKIGGDDVPRYEIWDKRKPKKRRDEELVTAVQAAFDKAMGKPSATPPTVIAPVTLAPFSDNEDDDEEALLLML